ncbi:PELOTA RNA binding domain-containing protein [Nitrosomonas cryotolerans]|uniref:PELOTA RNA binding domain-containing protein n=1 Tax=Nitrosomonas cryotolerans ATCC 49181 TaxID=1131553 RepID=A0A1N6JIL5_9PROT|nr:cysteine protease StiP family protein [Nitrosomonas cryotolerans]SFP89263.1 PELOTA RNA binding domain-containing protein [Nitrosomonas cryotolerans]SIO44212.1 PELOTA RNA binding domain-containing protein [Nitrosomonas cryotolerans ATCC 49181]
MPEAQAVAAPRTALLGSYAARDCLFLLKPIVAQYQSIAHKEQLIQSGQMHYSEVVHQETAPTAAYSQLFLQMTAQYKTRLANEIMRLAQLIAEQRTGRITLLSLARAGTPMGVLLQRALTHFLKRQSTHYSISIIRDRGLDNNALDYVLAQGHAPESIVFVDGWTAKGVITRELHQAVSAYNKSRGVAVPSALFVVSDIGGTADVQATFDDYTIPSALMNSTVSGLVSRSILNAQVGPADFHGCVQYTHLHQYDRSNWFVDEVFQAMRPGIMSEMSHESKATRQAMTQSFITHIQAEYAVSDINRIKPGIAEATRVLLRRIPDQVLIRQKGHTDTRHLERLAFEKSVAVKEFPGMPFGACALIKDVL